MLCHKLYCKQMMPRCRLCTDADDAHMQMMH